MSSRNKKIILATGIFPPEEGGPATYSKLLQDRLPEYGFHVSVFPFRTVRHFPKVLRHVVYMCKLLRAAYGADVVYAQDTVSVGLPACIAAKLSGRKFLIRVPGDYAWEQARQRFGVKDSIDEFQHTTYNVRIELLRRVQKFVVSRADLVITPSIYFRDVVRGWVTKKNKVITIYNGIDFKEIDSVHSNTYVPKTIITAGRLVPWKGFGELISLMQKLPQWHLVIAGDGPLREELQSLIERNKLEDRVVLLGTVPRIELVEKIKQSEIFVLNTHFESFSYQIVEVMRARTPIVTTRVGNLAEIIENQKEGVLVEPNNQEQIISAIQDIHNNVDKRKVYIEHAYTKSKQFSIEQTLIKTVEAIKTFI